MAELGSVGYPLLGLKVLVTAAFCVAAWRVKALTGAGAILTGIVGITILIFGGWVWALPILAFFVTSTALGKLPGFRDEVHPPRTGWQVLANGAVAWAAVCMLVAVGNGVWRIGDSLSIYVGAIAAANADTWATEIGIRFGGTPHDLFSGRGMQPGTSGAITGVGTISALIGSFVVAACIPLVDTSFRFDWRTIGFVTLAGWFGSMADSLVASVAQRRYRCRVCGDETELPVHCGSKAAPHGGLLTNNQVNWICTAVGGLAAWALLRL